MSHARIAIVAAFLTLNAAAAQAQHAHPKLGTVAFRNSGNAAAQEPLQRGVALLHSFEYGDAAEAFIEAQRADRGFALAYWLEALTYSHVLWGEEDLPEARAALARLAPNPDARVAKAKTDRERAFGRAVEAFFAEGTLAVRGLAYADSILKLARSDTTDTEAAAFASQASMVAWYASPPAQRGHWARETQQFAQRVFDANPDHPGATHYLIHFVDMEPKAAPEALKYARIYDKIAPDAEHALHMPSHVYLPLGLWPEVTSSNQRAWAASRRDVIARKAPATSNSWHSLDWLHYAYLQQGRYPEARALIDTASMLLKNATIADENPDPRYVVGLLSFRYAWESGQWNAYPANLPKAAEILTHPVPTQRAVSMMTTAAYQAAVAALHARHDRAPAETVMRAFRTTADSLPAQSPRGASLRRLATQLEAMLAREDRNYDRAVELLTSIADSEPNNASLPPTILPSNELLGYVLLDAKRSADAAVAFRKALALRPNRAWAVRGLEQALGTGVSRLDWMAGCWARTSGTRIVEEQWMAPRGNMMLGISRTVQDGKVREYETMRIYERGDSLVFAANPSGQAPSEFTAARATASSVTFSNPAHDFPQRVIYSAGTADSLFARVEGTMNGQERGVDFKYQRVACPGPQPHSSSARSP